MLFKDELSEKINLVNVELEKYMESNNKYTNLIFDSMKYSLFAGGKRLRPIMLLSVNEMFGGKRENALPFACGLEMIHTYSLIHDDLPAMDNDDYRRGKLTNHKVFGENIAILAGDALLSYAYEIILKSMCENSSERSVRALKEIAYAAGINGMVAGQVIDVISEGKAIDKETLEYIHENKTAAMIRGAFKVGAILGGANEEDIKILDEAALCIGLAFQIQDDILDVVSTAEELGKPIHSDEKNEKVTYVSMFGIEKSKNIVEEYSNRAIELLGKFGNKSGFLTELTEHLIRRRF